MHSQTSLRAKAPDIVVRILGPGDGAVLDKVSPDVFDNPVQPELARAYLKADHLHMIVALAGDLVIGMASAVTYFHPDKPKEFFFNELGVADKYLRRGIGARLVGEMFDLARRLGHDNIWLGTEVDNHAANGLYRHMDGKREVMNIYEFDLTDVDASSS